ncbi:hypothetical protein SGPA1_20984 [Streptomyces misionensis JCM 4497]
MRAVWYVPTSRPCTASPPHHPTPWGHPRKGHCHALGKIGGLRLRARARGHRCGRRRRPRERRGHRRRGEQRLLRRPLRRHVERSGRAARHRRHRPPPQGLHRRLRPRRGLQPGLGRHPPHWQRLLHRPRDRQGQGRGRVRDHLLRRRQRTAPGVDLHHPEQHRRRIPGAHRRLRRHPAGLRRGGRRRRRHRGRGPPDAGHEGPQGDQPGPPVLGHPAGADQRADQRRRQHPEGRQERGRPDRRGQHHGHGLLRRHGHRDGPGRTRRRPVHAGADAVRRLRLRLRQPRHHPDDRQERRRLHVHPGRRPDGGELRRAERCGAPGLLVRQPRPAVRRQRQLAAHVQRDRPEQPRVHGRLRALRGQHGRRRGRRHDQRLLAVPRPRLRLRRPGRHRDRDRHHGHHLRQPGIRRPRRVRRALRRHGLLQPRLGDLRRHLDPDGEGRLVRGRGHLPDHRHRHGHRRQAQRHVHAHRHRQRQRRGRQRRGVADQRRLRERRPRPLDLHRRQHPGLQPGPLRRARPPGHPGLRQHRRVRPDRHPLPQPHLHAHRLGPGPLRLPRRQWRRHRQHLVQRIELEPAEGLLHHRQQRDRHRVRPRLVRPGQRLRRRPRPVLTDRSPPVRQPRGCRAGGDA